MSETLTLANFDINNHIATDVMNIGATADKAGVIDEMALVFGHDFHENGPTIQSMGELTFKVGPAKELQDNIGKVQDVLGTDATAVDIARDWVKRSGLLVPAEKLYASNEAPDNREIELILITGGVRNWIMRRANRAIEFALSNGSPEVVLVAGNRLMKTTEGADVEEGMTESDYMRNVAADHLRASGLEVSTFKAGSQKGDDVMNIAAASLHYHLAHDDHRVVVVSNAGAWTQNVGQFRRAARNLMGHLFDEDGQQIMAVSDGFELGTGTEPTSTHQNPFTALGQITRNAQELLRQY